MSGKKMTRRFNKFSQDRLTSDEKGCIFVKHHKNIINIIQQNKYRPRK